MFGESPARCHRDHPAVRRRSSGNHHPPAEPSLPAGGHGHVVGDRAVVAEHHEAVEAAQEPAVVGDGDDRARELVSPSSRASADTRSRLSVGSSSSSRFAPEQLEQEDLEPGLLAARQRLERAARRSRAARSGAASPSPGHARRRGRGRCRGRATADSGWSCVWGNSPGTTPAPSRHAPSWPTVLTGEQTEEVALADAVGAEDGDPLAVPHARCRTGRSARAARAPR